MCIWQCARQEIDSHFPRSTSASRLTGVPVSQHKSVLSFSSRGNRYTFRAMATLKTSWVRNETAELRLLIATNKVFLQVHILVGLRVPTS